MQDRHSNEADTARWARNALRQLPERKAPATLAPRVLAAVARLQARPWYRRPWAHWPNDMRWLTMIALTAIVAGLFWAAAHTRLTPPPMLAEVDAQVAASLKPASAFVSAADVVGRSLRDAVRSALGPWTLAVVLTVFGSLWAATLGLGATCWRIAGARPS